MTSLNVIHFRVFENAVLKVTVRRHFYLKRSEILKILATGNNINEVKSMVLKKHYFLRPYESKNETQTGLLPFCITSR
jgi:hypothetical protein